MTQKKSKRETSPPHRSQIDAERRKLLGATLRSFRQKRKLSLNQVVYDLLDLNGASPLIEIEKGKRLPTLSTLRKIGRALQLSPAEMAEIEGLAGYRSETRMPPLDQIVSCKDHRYTVLSSFISFVALKIFIAIFLIKFGSTMKKTKTF
ncbi:MAG: helix-turn-helix domain-containing protein [Roseiflexus sp.]